MWQAVLQQLTDVIADPYIAAVENDFVDWIFAELKKKMVSGPALNDKVAEFRKLHKIMTHEEHVEQNNKVIRVARALSGVGPDQPIPPDQYQKHMKAARAQLGL